MAAVVRGGDPKPKSEEIRRHPRPPPCQRADEEVAFGRRPGLVTGTAEPLFPQNVIAEHEIRNISCAAQDPEDLCAFAYVTKDLQTGHHYCHVFSTVDVVGGGHAARTLGVAPGRRRAAPVRSEPPAHRAAVARPGFWRQQLPCFWPRVCSRASAAPPRAVADPPVGPSS